MKLRIAPVFLAVLFLPVIALGQEQSTGMLQRNSIEWFYKDANNHKQPLLLKLLQFTAPYPGYYQQTSLDTNGNVLTVRVVPDWAMQNSSHAVISDALLTEIKQKLAQINVPATPAAVDPERDRLHSAFIFYDGHDFSRLNYNGPNPPQIEAILELLRKELMTADRAREEEFAAHEKLMRERYGDWKNRPGITVNGGNQVHNCKGNRALVLSIAGQRKAVASGPPATVSLYHALVFYPFAALSGSGSGGRWSDDPVQSNVMTWRVLNDNGSVSENTSERKLEILNNAIDATVTIAGKTYQLAGGNMFVVRMGADWQPTVTQLKEIFDEQATSQASLNRFKALLKNDASVQPLELY